MSTEIGQGVRGGREKSGRDKGLTGQEEGLPCATRESLVLARGLCSSTVSLARGQPCTATESSTTLPQTPSSLLFVLAHSHKSSFHPRSTPAPAPRILPSTRCPSRFLVLPPYPPLWPPLSPFPRPRSRTPATDSHPPISHQLPCSLSPPPPPCATTHRAKPEKQGNAHRRRLSNSTFNLMYRGGTHQSSPTWSSPSQPQGDCRVACCVTLLSSASQPPSSPTPSYATPASPSQSRPELLLFACAPVHAYADGRTEEW
jgi:hypothetical protein